MDSRFVHSWNEDSAMLWRPHHTDGLFIMLRWTKGLPRLTERPHLAGKPSAGSVGDIAKLVQGSNAYVCITEFQNRVLFSVSCSLAYVGSWVVQEPR